MTNDQLLAELQNRKLIAEPEITKVKREILLSGRSAEELIHEKRLVDDEKVAQFKSEVFGIPYQKIDVATYDEKLLGLIPEETARAYGAVALAEKDGLLIAGMLHPDDTKAQDALKFIARRDRLNLGAYVISFGDWQDILRKYSPFKTNIEAAVSSLNIKPGGSASKIVSIEDSGASGAEEAPIIKIVTDIFREAVESAASDVHIEPQQNHLRVRFRLNGDLKETATLPAQLIQPITSRIKVICNLKIDESRVPQDGRFRAKILDREIDFRVATFPTPLGEKIAIRILDPSTGLKSLDRLGFAGPNLTALTKGLEKPFGMVLVTGPTGSGKTTTLYAILQSINEESVNIVSLEDPVEYFVEGVNQSQVRPEIGYDFASGLRQILRQDPDVIMVGEIRDSETANLAVQAALTGHVVLSTLHTNNSAGVIPRLVDMKVELFLLPVSLNLIVAQRLVGVLCPDCKIAEDAPAEVQKKIAQDFADLPSEVVGEFKPPYKIYHVPGCNKCKGKGIVGRTQIHEVLTMTPELQEVINTGPTLQKITKEARRQGMVSLRQDGLLKALRGITSVEEIIRTTEDTE